MQVSQAVENGHAVNEKQSRRKTNGNGAMRGEEGFKRKCVSTACVACRKRKSKCDGNTPACAACASVYRTPCVYDPNSDHRRKGVYRKSSNISKARTPTLGTLVNVLVDLSDEDAMDFIRRMRTSNNPEKEAEKLCASRAGTEESPGEEIISPTITSTSPLSQTFESHLASKMGEIRLEEGSTVYYGGTSNLLYVDSGIEADNQVAPTPDPYQESDDPITSWTTVTSDRSLIIHLLNMYFSWHYPYFTTLSKSLFLQDFHRGSRYIRKQKKRQHCTPLLVNAMLALGCHFTADPGSREDPSDSATAGDHFFKEAKRLIMVNDEHENPKLTTVQAFGLMSVREAGCGREVRGWVYSGMSFRMACDLGLNLDSGGLSALDEAEEDARRITFWGCFLFDKCWSNYLGRLPQLPSSIVTVPKFEVIPEEDSEVWSPYSDAGFDHSHVQPARTRLVALHLSGLCEISSDLMSSFYNPIDMYKPIGKQAELKKLGEIHQRLELWRRDLPKELEAKENALPPILIMHMFFHILYIHLFRPFLKYTENTSPLPAHVSPRKICTYAATMISKMLRLYRRSHGLRQICNIVVYIVHSACAIHLLNLPEKNAQRDIVQGVMYLEEIAESWLCARRTLAILSVLATRWKVQIPAEAATVLARTSVKFGTYMQKYKPDLRSSMGPPSTLSTSSPSGPMSGAHSAITVDTGAPPIKGDESTILNGHPATPSHDVDVMASAAVPLTMDPTIPFPENNPQRTHPLQAQLEPVGHPVTTELPGPPLANGASGYPAAPGPSFVWNNQEFWLRDQSQFASNFGNWDTVDTPQDSQWLHNLASTVGGSMEVDMVNAGIPKSETWIPTVAAAGYPQWNSY